jgi:Dolichyl-phosphate-mannose-protein mannosyltransferase
MTKTERLTVFFFFGTAVVLRILFAHHLRVDSDEPQHLHMVWAWTAGLFPYRDTFDNHMPLFHALCAPLFHFLGVRPDILIPMRLALIPLWAVTIWCVWKISASIFSRRTALWTTVFATFFPPFFISSVEFRTDQLWTTVWLVLLTAIVTGRATTRGGFVAGLLLGLAFSVSLKTSLLAVSLALACVGTLLVNWYAGEPVNWLRLLKYFGAMLAGVVAVPLLIVLFFVGQHAGKEMWYCLITYNLLIKTVSRSPSLFHSLMWWIMLLPIELIGIWVIWKWQSDKAIRSRFTFIFLTGAFCYTTLLAFWPLREGQTFLPIFPVLAISIAPCLLWLATFVSRRIRLASVIVPLLIVIIEITFVCIRQPPFRNKTTNNTRMIADVLKLTDANDFVMDAKGETIYRRRPYYYITDKITKAMIDRGLVRDDIPQRLIETRTALVTTAPRPPKGDVELMENNYLPIAFRLAALGKIVRPRNALQNEPVRFEVMVPSRYTLVCEAGKIAGVLDETAFDGPRELTPGPHVFRQTSGTGAVAVIWARAVERGYSPFAEPSAN